VSKEYVTATENRKGADKKNHLGKIQEKPYDGRMASIPALYYMLDM